MTENQRTTTPDPEQLTEDERKAILNAVSSRTRRELENQIIAKELARRAQEAERRASS
jgi:hypothetical protein